MIWSRYNYLYKSNKHGYFLYNSRTNSFMSLNEATHVLLSDCIKSQKEAVEEVLDESLLKKLIRAKALVNDFDDDNYLIQKKFLKYNENFNSKSLGLVIVPTFSCNFACPYCYERNLPGDIMNEETENKLIEFIKSFSNANQLHICWHGGEPLIGYESIKRILSKIKNEASINLTAHSMVSNGFLFDDEKCFFFKEHNLSSIQVTIDGLPEKHNKSRRHKSGQPTYEVIVRNIETIFRIMPNCHVIVRINIHEDNKSDPPVLYHELKKKWKGKNFSISMKYAIDHGECRVPCIKDWKRVKYAKDLYEKHGIKEINFYPEVQQLGGCTADSNSAFVVGPQGELYKCWVDVGKSERKIGSIYENKINLSLYSEYLVGTDMFSDPKCLSCFLLPVCDGGCALFRLNHKLTKAPYNVCPVDKDEMSFLLDAFYEQQTTLL